MRLTKVGEAFLEDENWKKDLVLLKQSRVLKMPQIIKSIMYLLCFTREQICEPKTQNFWWKIANKYIDN